MPQESFSSRWDAADAPLHPVGFQGPASALSRHLLSAVFQTNLYNGLALLFQQTPRAACVDCHFPPCERLRYLQNGTSHLHRSRDDVRFSPFLDRSLQGKLAIERRPQATYTPTPKKRQTTARSSAG
ncbi:hypothetical protein ACCO45_013174 [Purpureocillium lilacinum]|uniref:Uncharacterized protein n=1 Tax=Purpureocillium lilacinum TaxID=33203 RepID=A0ACC4DCN0_PURLI